ncbi:unnamed protein product [Closterium sp. NIES-64]|nr:unnamed protein product [Closterium sp. NIES-64]
MCTVFLNVPVMSAFADGTAGKRARGGGKRNGGRAAAAKGGPSGRQSQDADGGDEGDHAEPDADGGDEGIMPSRKLVVAESAPAAGLPQPRAVPRARRMRMVATRRIIPEPEARGGGMRNGGRAAAAKGGPSGRQSQDADGGDEKDHAEPEARGGGMRKTAAGLPRLRPIPRASRRRMRMEATRGIMPSRKLVVAAMRNGGRAAAAKGGPSGSQDADGGDEKDHAEPEARGGGMRRQGCRG